MAERRWAIDRSMMALLATRSQGRQFEVECFERYNFSRRGAWPLEERGSGAPPTSSNTQADVKTAFENEDTRESSIVTANCQCQC